ncbi:MAG: hypothetical protein Q9164_005175, partial [Protoblastenia rupestris]
MFSPEAGGAASLVARSNPRRRQRNASEDSVANRQPVKRRKRSGLSKETFEPPIHSNLNGHIEPSDDAPLTNGHAYEPGSLREESGDNTNLVIRNKNFKKVHKERRSSQRDGDVELTKNENYIITQQFTTPASLLNSLIS